MTGLDTSPDAAAEPRPARGLWADAARRIGRDVPAMVCLGVIVLYALAALVAGIALSDWAGRHDYSNVNRPPSVEHWLGTDEFGRSVLEKTVLGAKVSMTVGFLANIIAIPLGVLLGAVAGYYGGWIDDAIVWLYTTLAAVPGIVRVIAVQFAFQGVVLLAGTPFELDYIVAARAAGRDGLAILLHHVAPNVAHLGIINFSLGFIGAVTAEVALSWLGLGVAGVPSWGKMIAAAQMELLVGRWWQIASAGGAMFVLVLALNVLGDRLRDALDPKLRRT